MNEKHFHQSNFFHVVGCSVIKLGWGIVWSNVFWRLSFTFQAFKLISIFRQKLLCHFPPNWFHFEKSQAPVVRLAGLSMKIESKEFFIASIFQTDNSAPSLPHSLKPQTQNKYRRQVFAPCLPDTRHKKPFKMMNSWKTPSLSMLPCPAFTYITWQSLISLVSTGKHFPTGNKNDWLT